MKEIRRYIDDKSFVNYRLGENAKENHLIIDDADKDDWWFHIDGHPSAHCIIERVDIDTLDMEFASELIRKNSKHKEQKNLRFCFTQVKNLKKTKNPGEVKLLKKPEIFVLP